VLHEQEFSFDRSGIDIDPQSTPPLDPHWATQEWGFTALDDSTTLEFISTTPRFSPVTPQDFGPTLDNVAAFLFADPIPGDAFGDRRVDASDLYILALNWHQFPRAWKEADFNGDRVVEAGDLNLLALNWQAGAGTEPSALTDDPAYQALAASLVPEPGSLAGVFLSFAALGRRRRR
jgi:hypothetical protein